MTSGSCWRRSSARTAMPNSSDPRWIPARLMSSCFTFFQTHSSGLSSGEYPGRKNNFSRPSSDATYSVTGGLVHTEAVQNQEHRARGVVHELLEELDEHRGVASTEEHVEVKCPSRRDRGDHIDRLAFSGHLDHRRLSDRGPRGACVVIGPHS